MTGMMAVARCARAMSRVAAHEKALCDELIIFIWSRMFERMTEEVEA